MSKKILIVEDESSIRGFIKVSFERNGYIIIEAETGEEGIRKVWDENPDVVILDIMLPGIDGFQVCGILRKQFPNLGIVILTARNLDMDRIMGLEYGADDYVVKPFNPLELVLRVEALLRRMDVGSERGSRGNLFNSGPFKIDTYGQKVYKNCKEVDVTPKEYLLMKLFIENPGKAFSRDELLDIIWGRNFFGDPKVVDVNILRLRRKIEDSPSHPMYIETVWGTGYRWVKG